MLRPLQKLRQDLYAGMDRLTWTANSMASVNSQPMTALLPTAVTMPIGAAHADVVVSSLMCADAS